MLSNEGLIILLYWEPRYCSWHYINSLLINASRKYQDKNSSNGVVYAISGLGGMKSLTRGRRYSKNVFQYSCNK